MQKGINFIRNNSKLLFLIFLVLIMIFLITGNNLYYKNKYLGNNYIDNKNLEKIKNTHQEFSGKINLYFDGTIIPYSNNNFYLLYVKDSQDYKKIYTNSNYKIKLINAENNHSINLLLYNDKYYKIVKLELTNIPVVSISKDNLVNLYGFDSNVKELNCEYSLRGDSSKFSDKKGYKINLYDRKNNKLNISLLGMEANNSWILNPIFFDNSYMREKISYDIWNELSSDFNHNLEYIELVINDEYQGLYYLQEKVTMDTFDGNKKKDLLISTKTWKTVIENPILDEATVINNNLIDEFEIEEGLEGDYKTQIDILKSFNSSISDENSKYTIKYDLENMVNYGLFLNFTMARDNTYKNQKIIFKDMGSYYFLQKTVWDLDWSFNNENIKRYYPDLNMEITNIDYDLAVPYSLKENELYKNYSKNKYFTFRENYYNEENISNVINKYRNYLESYGAVTRDSKKWNNEYYLESIKVIKDFVKDRIQILDEYFGEL